MEEKNQHFQDIMLYYFKKGKNASETQKIFAVYRKGAVTDWMCQKWLAKIPTGDFLLDKAPWSSRWLEVDSDQIETVIENNHCYAMQQIASLVMLIALIFGFHVS